MQNKICNGGRQQEFFVKISSHVLCQGKSAEVDLEKVHHLIKNPLDSEIHSAPQARRIKYYLKNWVKLTQDPNILSMIQGYNIYRITKEFFPVALSTIISYFNFIYKFVQFDERSNSKPCKQEIID